MNFLEEYEKLKKSHPKAFTHSFFWKNENCDYGNYLYGCKNMYYSFDCPACEDCLYCYNCIKCKNCVDSTFCYECQYCYECLDVDRSYNSSHLNYCSSCYDCHWCYDCVNCHDCFGCISLEHKQYCILNHQYSKERYSKRLEEIKKDPNFLKKYEKLKKSHSKKPTHNNPA